MFNIPGFDRYYITECGHVFNKSTNKQLNGSINGSGYLFFHLTGDDGLEHNVGQHRLVALARIEKPVINEKLVVNHKDGIKLNNTPSNLEWCTYSENQIHAGHNGLSTKACSVEVRSVRSEVVMYFRTMQECSAVLGVSKDAVSYRCQVGPTRVFEDGYQYRSPASHEPWPMVGDIGLAMLENGTKKAVLVKNLNTGEVNSFEKLKDASAFLGVVPGNLTGHFKRASQPVIKDSFQLKKGNDTEDWQQPVSLNKQKVVVEDTNTGTKIVYESARQAALANGLSPTALSYRLSSGNKSSFSDGKTYTRV